jgi:hypothetical protein
MSFEDDLSISLTLTISGQAHTIPGGNVKSLELSVHSYGYEAAVSFVVSAEQSSDALLSPFTQQDLIEVALEVGVYIKPEDAETQTLKLTGLATDKGFSEHVLANVEVKQNPVLYRHYHLAFADPAQVLWKQHYPCDLLTDSTLKTLIGNHAGEKISLQYNWDALETQYSIIALSLGAEGNRASFYDFILWLADTRNGVFSYDAAGNSYQLSSAKSTDGTAAALDFLEVAAHGLEFPANPRYQPQVLNAYSENPQTKPITNAQTVSPMRRDYIDRYAIAADLESRATLETARFVQRLHEVGVSYRKFPLKSNPPGQLVKFDGAGWLSALFVSGNTYRVRDWRLEAHAAEQELTLNHNMPYGRYVMDLSLRLENSGEKWVSLPPYAAPAYPLFVEGKVVSDQGGDQDATYQTYQDQDTSVVYYEVSIPLWNNLKIRAPFEPNLTMGQFYFPLYKNARVLVALGFNTAAIVGFLDWRNGAALPGDTQGNQLVMGQSTTSQTSLQHTYVDQKPQFQILRKQDSDTELLKMSDGSIVLQTQEEEEN